MRWGGKKGSGGSGRIWGKGMNMIQMHCRHSQKINKNIVKTKIEELYCKKNIRGKVK